MTRFGGDLATLFPVARSLGLLLAWIAGSAAAISVAWAGVSVVDRQAIDPALQAVSDVASVESRRSGTIGSESTVPPDGTTPSAEGARVDLETGAVGVEAGTGGSVASQPVAGPPDDDNVDRGASPDPDPATSTTTTTTTSTTDHSTSTTGRPTTASTAQPTTPMTTPTSTTAPTTTVPTTGATTTTVSSTQPTSQTLAFNLVGGSTAISFASSGVSVLWATPNPGFTVSIEPESPGVKVEFRSEGHRSRVDAWWSDGPRHEIREEPRD